MSAPDNRRALPKRPWNVLWVSGGSWAGGGRTYLIDADGRKIATLLGARPQREAVAAALIDAFGEPGEKTP